jgi:hypothetical protein
MKGSNNKFHPSFQHPFHTSNLPPATRPVTNNNTITGRKREGRKMRIYSEMKMQT